MTVVQRASAAQRCRWMKHKALSVSPSYTQHHREEEAYHGQKLYVLRESFERLALKSNEKTLKRDPAVLREKSNPKTVFA